MLNLATLSALQGAIAECGVDGWLLFDFQGMNPVSVGVLALRGMVTRRVFALVPRDGVPTAITHNIEQGPWRDWPPQWKRVRYSSWRELESALTALVGGKTVAMEYSAGDAVPYVDRVPGGVLEMVRNAGATVVSSGELVTRFYAVWTAAQLASHRRAASIVADAAREGFARVGERARAGTPMAEHELQRWIADRLNAGGLEFDHPPIVAVDANAADAHYSPSADRPVPIVPGSLVLVDLWGKEPNGIYADQTWMASVGEPSSRAKTVWNAVRDARDAAIELLRARVAAHSTPLGAELDDAARRVITERGFGDKFVHRTGHSIDARSLHGAGPHLDNFETREERRLLPGVGFSIEPGIYLPGELGVRSEVNAWVGADAVIITPDEPQRDMAVV